VWLTWLHSCIVTALSSLLQLACVLTSSALVDWVAMVAATTIATALIVRSVQPVVLDKAANFGRIVLGSIVGVEVLFGILLKTHFFWRISY
jgi:hypothetical protein